MKLHSDSVIDPMLWLIAQVMFLGRWILRFAVIGGKKSPDDTDPVPLYVAIGWLNPKEWVAGFQGVHDLVSNPASPLLVGKTFQQEKFEVRQNQLLLLRWVPRFLVPASLRYRVAGKDKHPFWWCIEVYDFYAINPTGELGRYGRFVEVAPAPRKLNPRWTLGLPSVWAQAGRLERFDEYLRSEILPVYPQAEDEELMAQAQRTGCLMGIASFYLLHLMVRWLQCYPKHHENGVFRPAYAA